MHEYLPSSVFVAHIPEGSLVVDIGANLGEYTALAARATGKQGRVVAYEPNPLVRERLVRNIKVNNLENVEVSPLALGSEDGEAILRVPSDESGLGTLRAGVSGTEYHVQTRRLDTVLSEADKRRVAMVKVDVEGLELQVFHGAQETLETARPMILYECAAEVFDTRHGRAVTPTMEFLEDKGYNNFVITMTRNGDWALRRLTQETDPRDYREPWEVLVVVAIHRTDARQVRLWGKSSLRPCRILERLGH